MVEGRVKPTMRGMLVEIEEGPLLLCEGGSAGEHTGEVGRQEGGWPYGKANIEPNVNIVVADEST